jgi:alkylation response protein AidB-like acyl-CoA dehydrogenase
MQENVLPVYQGPKALLSALKSLHGEITTASQRMETAGEMDQIIFQKIVSTGLLRALHPKNLGGAEYEAPDMLPLIEEIAKADGSTAWSFMVAAEVPALFQRLPDQVLKQVFSSDCDVLARAPLTPKPGTKAVDGGFLVNGTWPLASGSYKADWFIVSALVFCDDLEKTAKASGAPELRLLLIPGDQVELQDNWKSIGLRSTESNDVKIENIFVPEEHSAIFSANSPHAYELDIPEIRKISFYSTMGPLHLGVILGITRAMLDELVEHAQTKHPFLNPSIILRDDPNFQQKIGSMEIRLSAARAFAISASHEIWKLGGTASPLQRTKYRAATAYVHDECSKIGTEVFRLGGTTVLYNDSLLQRRFRDLTTACQHIMGNPDIGGSYGALTLGADLAGADGL